MNIDVYVHVGQAPSEFPFLVWYFDSKIGVNDSRTLCESLPEAIEHATIRSTIFHYKKATITDKSGNILCCLEDGKMVA